MTRGKIGTVLTEIDGKWYVAKPLPFYSWRDTVKARLLWTWRILTGRILTGRAIAVHYKQDEGGNK